MAKRTVTVDYWPEREDGPNEERGIVEGDWRDGDITLDMQGLTMVSNDTNYEESHGSSQPRWELGCQARDANNRVVMEFGGEPPYPFKEALLYGRIVYGFIACRDQQRHGR